MKATRVDRHVIKKGHKMWKDLDDMCFKSKNLYNYANYIQRQCFVANEKIYKCNELDKMIQNSEAYKELGSQSAQRLLRLLDKNWKSFFVSIKDYHKNPNKYLGKPKLPRYKKKDGRYICELKNIQFRIENKTIAFSLKKLRKYNGILHTNISTKPLGMKIIPKGSCYVLEIVYEIEVPELKEQNNRIVGIDLGVDNLATLTNNVGVQPIVINGRIIKSINQYYNKKRSKLQSDIKKRHNMRWSNSLQKLQDKRDSKIDYHLHCTSKSIIDYCIGLDIDTIVIGLNKTWKQESSMNSKANQNFISIPYDKLINQIKYKAENIGLNVVITEESYTSGCSFLDNDEIGKSTYDKSRRITRGLFRSNNGICINADVNGSYNIIKKVFPKAFVDGIEGVGLHPIRVNV